MSYKDSSILRKQGTFFQIDSQNSETRFSKYEKIGKNTAQNFKSKINIFNKNSKFS